LYLGGGFYTARAVAVRESYGNWVFYHICRDYLGSITQIANSVGSVVQELSYDAWGQLRNPLNQTVYAPGTEPELFLGRGYTGHEHLPQFGLINMNARLYDPALGRLLSPDPFVKNPLFSQGFNRFTYAMNNPMKYTDPDGKNPLVLIGIGIFLAFDYLMNAHNNTPKGQDAGNPGNWAWNPTSWFKSTPNNPNPSGFMISVGGNLDGSSIYGSFSAGNLIGPMPSFGYSSDYGFGFGYNNNGSSNMYYPGYNYNAPEQAAARAIDEARYAIEVQRILESENATLSKFYAYGPIPYRTVDGYILEPGGPSTTLSGQDKRIPFGIYNVSPYSSTKFKNVYIISGDQVSSNRGILIHSGNYHYNTLGCFLPGSYYGIKDDDYYVGNSRAKLNELRILLQTNQATMVVWDINNHPYH